MGAASQAAALKNAEKNQNMLSFAKEKFNKELYEKVKKEYKKAKWGQFGGVGILLLIWLPCLFIKDETTLKVLLIAGPAFWILVLFPLWLIISNFTFAKKWKKYTKWYDNGSSIEEVYDIFEVPYK